jgi:hypothetical protein
MKRQIDFSLNLLSIGVLLGLLFGATACGPILNELSGPVPQVRAMDGVKLLHSGIEDGYDKATYMQEQYTLQPGQSRLLLRFNSMNSKINQIRTDGTNKVELQISLPTEAEATAAKTVLSACPVTKNWMMLATWNSAAPFTDLDHWSTPGGEYKASECVHAYDQSGALLKFDVTPWFINYLQARRVNFGLILIADQSCTVMGEASGASSPKLSWNEYPASY